MEYYGRNKKVSLFDEVTKDFHAFNKTNSIGMITYMNL